MHLPDAAKMSGVGVAILMLPLLFPIQSTWVIRLNVLLSVYIVVFTSKLKFPRNGLLVIFCTILFSVSYVFTDYRSAIAKKDLINCVLSSAIGISIASLLSLENRFNVFWKYFTSCSFAICVFTSMIGLIKFIGLNVYPINLLSYSDNGQRIIGTSTVSEYNTFSLSLTIGLLSGSWVLKNLRSGWSRRLFVLGMVLIMVSLTLTGSRRAWLFGLIWIANLFVLRVNKKNHSSMIQNQKISNANLIVALVLCLFFLGVLLGLRDGGVLNDTKEELFSLTDRSATLFDEQGYQTRIPYIMLSLSFFVQSSVVEKMFGSGFNYFNKFGSISLNSEDYPHNFVLSTLLYGGVFQLILIFAWILQAWRIRCGSIRYNVFQPLVLVLIIFSAVSSNSIYSIILVPVLINIIGAHNLVYDSVNQ